MKRWQKVASGILAGLFVLIAAAAIFVELRWDRRYDGIAGPALRATTDPAVIERGRYLVNGPAHCSNCHVASFEDFVRADAGEPVPMQGGVAFEMGPMGRLSPANLTPDPETGIGRYTDQQLFRMLRHNIKPDGTATIWPMMPFFMMADDDLVAIVSYLRSLPPTANEVPPPDYTFMGKALRLVMPAFKPQVGHTAPAVAPAEAPTAERGEYIARYVANCVGCHTNHDPATMRFTGPEFAGGAVFPSTPGVPGVDPGLSYRSPNLTPHPSGVLARIGSREAWVARFRAGRVHAGSPMHWGPFSRMSQADLEALWVYFNTLEPIANEVGETVFRAES